MRKQDAVVKIDRATGKIKWILGEPSGWPEELHVPQDEINKITWDNVRQFPSWSRIREYTHTNSPELVWEAVMKDNSKENLIGWIIFGAERIPSLDPSHNKSKKTLKVERSATSLPKP